MQGDQTCIRGLAINLLSYTLPKLVTLVASFLLCLEPVKIKVFEKFL